MTEEEGLGESLAVQRKFLYVCTRNLHVKIWDLSKRDLRLHIHPVIYLLLLFLVSFPMDFKGAFLVAYFLIQINSL